MKNSGERYEFAPLLDDPDKLRQLEDYLIKNSNLPGPRGNLTLAFALADAVEKQPMTADLWRLVRSWLALPPAEAPTNNPREFLPFCGLLAISAQYFHENEEAKGSTMSQFKTSMNDPRWRVREGAAMGLQRIAEKDFNAIKHHFSLWYDRSNYLEKRAFIATLAHPPILNNNEAVKFSLKLSGQILDDVLSTRRTDRASEEFVVLSKGLQYALSVFVAYQPEEGFGLLKKYAHYNDSELKKIIKSNLGKTRLTKKYGKMVDEVLKAMDESREG